MTFGKLGIITALIALAIAVSGTAHADVPKSKQCAEPSRRLTLLVMNIAAAEKARLEAQHDPANLEHITDLSRMVVALGRTLADKNSQGATTAEITAILAAVEETRDPKNAPAAPAPEPVKLGSSTRI